MLAGILGLRGLAVAQTPESAINALVAELGKQQALIATNQQKIDEKIALIAEDLRIARIFASRGGGKGGAK